MKTPAVNQPLRRRGDPLTGVTAGMVFTQSGVFLGCCSAHSMALANSPALAKRSSGSFARARAMVCTKPAGRPGRMAFKSGSGAFRCCKAALSIVRAG